MFDADLGTAGSEVHVKAAREEEALGNYWIDVAVANFVPKVSLEHTCRILYQ
jgi:hypothetical protein